MYPPIIVVNLLIHIVVDAVDLASGELGKSSKKYYKLLEVSVSKRLVPELH